MDDAIVELLNTGREKELKYVLDIIKRNINRKLSPQHVLIYGSRGIGKSFFLRLLQINLKRSGTAGFVLLPEEQLNVHQPEDFIRAIRSGSPKDEIVSGTGMGSWSSGGQEVWESEVERLKTVLYRKKI